MDFLRYFSQRKAQEMRKTWANQCNRTWVLWQIRLKEHKREICLNCLLHSYLYKSSNNTKVYPYILVLYQPKY